MRAGSVGLSVEAAREVLERRTFREAIRRGLGAVAPVRDHQCATFVAGGYGVMGAQPYETLEALVSKAASEESS